MVSKINVPPQKQKNERNVAQHDNEKCKSTAYSTCSQQDENIKAEKHGKSSSAKRKEGGVKSAGKLKSEKSGLEYEIKTTDGLKRNLTHLPPVKTCKDPCGMERKYYGTADFKAREKVIILLGASGSGKTTLVNFAANYFQMLKPQMVHCFS